MAVRRKERSTSGGNIYSPIASPNASGNEMIGVYNRRWILLIILCLLTVISNWVCFSMSAIEATASSSYPGLDFSVLVSVFNISNVVSCLFEPFFLRRIGLRRSVVIASFIMLFGNFVKMKNYENYDVTIYGMVAGFILVGLSQPIFQMGALVLAQDWFPSTERSFVTAMLVNSNQIGMVVAYVVGGIVVGEDSSKITPYLQYMTYSSLVCFVASVFLFKSLPPLPPSRSAATKRQKPAVQKSIVSYWKDSFKLMLCKNFNLAIFCYLVSSASANVVSADLSVLLEEDEASNVGTSTVASTFLGFMVIGTVLVGWYLNRTHLYKESSLVLLGLSSVTALASGLCFEYGMFSGFWFFLLFFGLVSGPGMPLNVDLAVEVAYPKEENDVIFVIVVLSNASNTGLIWVCYWLRNVTPIPYLSVLYVLSALSLLTMTSFGCFFTGEYNRIKFDTEKIVSTSLITPRTVFSS